MRKNIRFSILWIVFLSFSIQGCDALYRVLDKEGAEEKELVGEVVPFEKNPTIEEIQMLLKKRLSTATAQNQNHIGGLFSKTKRMLILYWLA